jgi:hypothetical protein
MYTFTGRRKPGMRCLRVLKSFRRLVELIIPTAKPMTNALITKDEEKKTVFSVSIVFD